jgi:hypothetical protein
VRALTREANASKFGREHWRDYGRVYLLVVLYGFVAWLSKDSLMNFLIVLAIVFAVQDVNERRDRRRLALFLEALRGLERRHETGEGA